MDELRIGDHVELITGDGVVFKGVIAGFGEDGGVGWLKLAPYGGFPYEDIAMITQIGAEGDVLET